MDLETFKEALMVYGARLHSWPEGLKSEATEALEDGPQARECKMALDEELRLEELLHARGYVEPAMYLAQSIIASAEDTNETQGIMEWFAENFFTRKAAAALAFTLIVGFMIGYMNSVPAEDDIEMELSALLDLDSNIYE